MYWIWFFMSTYTLGICSRKHCCFYFYLSIILLQSFVMLPCILPIPTSPFLDFCPLEVLSGFQLHVLDFSFFFRPLTTMSASTTNICLCVYTRECTTLLWEFLLPILLGISLGLCLLVYGLHLSLPLFYFFIF